MDFTRKVRAAAVQISPVLFSREGTTEKVLESIEKAAKMGAELVVFPETLIPYYPYFSFVQPPVLMGKEHLRLYEEAVEVPSPVTVTIDGTTIMVPIYTETAAQSPYTATLDPASTQATISIEGREIIPIEFPKTPEFYNLTTADGIPYWKIALLHSHDVLATTVLQTCTRYRNSDTVCQFCAIEQSLQAGRTIARKTPAQLAEVAAAAVRLDGVKHMVMTSGTPNTSDRGAAYLAECAVAIKQRVDLPIQAQCEPPDDFGWFQQLKDAGVDSLGMHLEAITPTVRAKIMPGKADVPVEYYFQAFTAAVEVFGRGQVSTYLLAGLGDTIADLVAGCDRLIQIGVYPFVVPFVPITGTPLAHHPAPSSEMMFALYQQVGALLKRSNMSSKDIKAGCGKCGACSALSNFED